MKNIAFLWLLALCAGCGGGGGGASTALPAAPSQNSGVPAAGGNPGAPSSSPLPTSAPGETPTPIPSNPPGTPPPLGTDRYWIIQGAAAAAMATDPVATSYFGNSSHEVITPATQVDPNNWHALPMQTFTSFAEFQAAVNSGTINRRTKALIYDNENWSFTPSNEQADPVGFMAQFASLAHQHGWLAIGTHAGYADSNGPAVAAGMCQFADMFSIQSQGVEADLPTFTAVVSATAAACRSSNARIKVFAGVSTGPTGQVVSAAQIAAAIMAVRGVADGYWLNIPQQSPYCVRCTTFDPELASQALALLPSPGP